MSRWKRTTSTTGCVVGTSVASEPISPSARIAPPARSTARPSPSSTKQRTEESIAARCPCRSCSVWCASAATCALAELQHRLEGGADVRSGAGDEEPLVPGAPSGSAASSRSTAAARPLTSSPCSARPAATAHV